MIPERDNITVVISGKNPVPEVGYTFLYLGLMERFLHVNINVLNTNRSDWGTRLPNGTYSGMIGRINRSEVEFGIGPFTFDPWRNQAIRFTYPVKFDHNVMLTPRPKIESDIAGLAKAFPMELWLLILACLVIFPIVLMFTERMEGKIFNFKTIDLPGKTIMWVVKAITQEGSDWMPTTKASRIVVATWLLAGVVIVSAYSGILIAMLTLPKVTITIDSVEDLVKQNDYKWVFQEQTSFTRHMETSEDPYKREAYQRAHKFIKYCRVRFTIDDKLVQFCTGNKARRALQEDFQASGVCRLYIPKEKISIDIVGMAFRDGSPYLPKTNRLLMAIMESGIFYKLFPPYDRCQHSPTKDNENSGINALDITSFGGPFILWGIGLILATFVFFYETLKSLILEPDESSEDY